jgi:hypothetical protein
MNAAYLYMRQTYDRHSELIREASERRLVTSAVGRGRRRRRAGSVR